MYYLKTAPDESFMLSFFTAAMEKLPALAAVRDAVGGKLVFLNEKGAAMLGVDSIEAAEALLEKNNIPGKGALNILPSGLRKWENASGELFYSNFEYATMQHDGRDYELIRLSAPLADPGNSELEQLVQQRTTQLQAALEAMQSSRDALNAALGKEKDLGELKSRFVSMASHEFRTPLSTILSSAYLAKQYDGPDGQDKRHKHLQRIVTSVNFLTDILNDFLSLGKIEEGKVVVKPVLFDVREQVGNMIQEAQGIVKAHQEIVYKHDGWPDVMLDPTLLRHIVLNLIGNAIKFSTKEQSVIEVITHTDSFGLTLKVRDNGIGMSPEDQAHLFERFFRGANVSNIQGTGLGLHIVAKYTELMKGLISCESQLDVGTTFTIIFPPISEF
ncbi:HAMP domain-containing histidine kinase [Chitinophaga horti]|uniref:histidine kinase n=1 Tax=Chitinophaga horti TaxID=2920382 RepID=A0ABY6J7B8_9BACT|nr:HAMP domain-containing sensor histidine kinase [Chitinophaga horti]UYQ95380.1 HAMP domain-containing histidine kinase [Chitinophaga horti]